MSVFTLSNCLKSADRSLPSAIPIQSVFETELELVHVEDKTCATTSSASPGSAQILTSPSPESPVAMPFEPELAPYVIALMLESVGARWEKAHAWTKYLVAETKQAEFIKQTFQDMAKRRLEVTEEFSSARVIVTNIAADATARDLFEVFSKYEPRM